MPVSHLIGQENEGFRYVMYNFNHERWSISIQASRFARVCLEEAMRYSFKRRTFGKLLIEHPVIRLKLAHMARQVEASHALMESITYQLTQMNFEEAVRVLGGPIALAKAQVTTVYEYCAREASQIFGGLSYTRGGQGEKVERLYREVRGFAIPASAYRQRAAHTQHCSAPRSVRHAHNCLNGLSHVYLWCSVEVRRSCWIWASGRPPRDTSSCLAYRGNCNGEENIIVLCQHKIYRYQSDGNKCIACNELTTMHVSNGTVRLSSSRNHLFSRPVYRSAIAHTTGGTMSHDAKRGQ